MFEEWAQRVGSAIPRGFSKNLLLVSKSISGSSQEIKNKIEIMIITFLNISDLEISIYNLGTLTLALIQQLNLILVPSLPSVKISVLEGALPK